MWCWVERAKAWDNLMLSHREPEATGAKCETPIDEFTKPGVRSYVNGTPGIVFETGTLVPGVLQAPGIEEQLRRSRKA
jgi:protein-disulfide isomerase